MACNYAGNMQEPAWHCPTCIVPVDHAQQHVQRETFNEGLVAVKSTSLGPPLRTYDATPGGGALCVWCTQQNQESHPHSF